MKNKEVSSTLVLVILGAAILGIIISSMIIKGPKHSTIATVPAIPANFPDVKNDSTYSSFLNQKALDPTQVVSVGGSQNNSPFNGTQ